MWFSVFLSIDSVFRLVVAGLRGGGEGGIVFHCFDEIGSVIDRWSCDCENKGGSEIGSY